MNDIKIKSIFDQAEEYFSAAQKELFKPEEDVVHYMVCKGAFKSIHSYLNWYLHLHEIKASDSTSMAELTNHCRQLDNKFNELNLDLLYNAHEEEDLWMNMATAQEFMDLAMKTRELVKS